MGLVYVGKVHHVRKCMKSHVYIPYMSHELFHDKAISKDVVELNREEHD